MSDHYSICLDWKGSGERPWYPYKFNHAWLVEADFEMFIKDIWNSECEVFSGDDPIHSFLGRINILKLDVVNW